MELQYRELSFLVKELKMPVEEGTIRKTVQRLGRGDRQAAAIKGKSRKQASAVSHSCPRFRTVGKEQRRSRRYDLDFHLVSGKTKAWLAGVSRTVRFVQH